MPDYGNLETDSLQLCTSGRLKVIQDRPYRPFATETSACPCEDAAYISVAFLFPRPYLAANEIGLRSETGDVVSFEGPGDARHASETRNENSC